MWVLNIKPLSHCSQVVRLGSKCLSTEASLSRCILLLSSLLSFNCNHPFRDSVFIVIISFIRGFVRFVLFVRFPNARLLDLWLTSTLWPAYVNLTSTPFFSLLYCMAGWLRQQIHILTMTYVTSHFADCLPVISQLSFSFVSELELLDYLFPGYVLK